MTGWRLGDRQSRGKRAFNAGRMAERAAAIFLRAKGYRILAERFRTPVGEIDVIAARGGVIIFVEVKWRPTSANAAEAIAPRQRARVTRAAQWYLGHNRLGERPCRFDAVLVVPWRIPVHIRDAWRVIS